MDCQSSGRLGTCDRQALNQVGVLRIDMIQALWTVNGQTV
jgi:hypothetical protein